MNEDQIRAAVRDQWRQFLTAEVLCRTDNPILVGRYVADILERHAVEIEDEVTEAIEAAKIRGVLDR